VQGQWWGYCKGRGPGRLGITLGFSAAVAARAFSPAGGEGRRSLPARARGFASGSLTTHTAGAPRWQIGFAAVPTRVPAGSYSRKAGPERALPSGCRSGAEKAEQGSLFPDMFTHAAQMLLVWSRQFTSGETVDRTRK